MKIFFKFLKISVSLIKNAPKSKTFNETKIKNFLQVGFPQKIIYKEIFTSSSEKKISEIKLKAWYLIIFQFSFHSIIFYEIK